jgi:hypothetical protein
MNLRHYLFEIDPYEGLDATQHTIDTQPFSLPTSVLGMVKDLKPNLIIEVGTWKGASAIYMADLLRDHSIPGHIICVDTWLGAEEMWTKPLRDLDGRYTGLKLVNGFPTFYYDFLKNVLASGHQNRITPFPITSSIAARVFAKLDVRADMIYIDGSHTYEDVMADFRAYWSLLQPGGIMVGDDYIPFWDVPRAVQDFSTEVRTPFVTFDDLGWLIKKVKD